MKKRLFLYLLLSVISIGFYSVFIFAMETPEDAYNNYISALKNDDVEQFKKYVSIVGNEQKQLQKEKNLYLRQTNLKLLYKEEKIPSYKLIYEAIDPLQDEKIWKTKKILRIVIFKKYMDSWKIYYQKNLPDSAENLKKSQTDW
jgi:hypothetical protein